MPVRKKNHTLKPKDVDDVQRAVTEKDFQDALKRHWAPHIGDLMRKSLEIAQQDDMVGHRERTLIFSYLFGKPDDHKPVDAAQNIQFNFTLVGSKEEAKGVIEGGYQVVDVTPVSEAYGTPTELPALPDHLTNHETDEERSNLV